MTEPGGPVADPPTLFPRGRTAVLLLLLVLMAVVIRVDLLRNTASPIPPAPAVSDAAAYRLLGAGLANGDGYVRPFDLQRQGLSRPTAEYPPGFPLMLAAADRVGVRSETGQRVILCLIGGLTVGLVGLITRRLVGDGAGLLAAVVATLHPSMWSTDTSPLAEPLAAFLAMAAIFAALAVWANPRSWRWILLGVITGFGALVRAELLVVGTILLGISAWRLALPGWRVAARNAALGGIGLLVVLAPWTIRNAAVFGEFVPLSNNAGSVIRGANCARAYSGEFEGLWVTNVADTGGDQVDPQGVCFTGFDQEGGRNEAEAAAELRSDGLRYARDHLGQLPRVLTMRIGRTVGVARFDQQVNFARFEGRTARWDRWGTRLFQVLAVVALLGAVAPWRRPGRRWMATVPVLAVAATVLATYGNFRFRAVADPAVVVLAVVAVAECIRRLRVSAGPDSAALSVRGGKPR